MTWKNFACKEITVLTTCIKREGKSCFIFEDDALDRWRRRGSMTLQQLRYFLDVCEYKGMAKAAQETNVSQPAISVAIRAMEKEFGVRLFLRVNKKLILTEEGIEFRHMAQDLMSRADYMETYFKNSIKANEQIRIGMSYVYDNLLSSSMDTFSNRNPNIKVMIFSFGNNEVMQLMETDAVDLVIMGTSEADDLSAYHTIEIGVCEPHFYTNENNPLAQQKVVNPADLADEPIVVFSEHVNYKKIMNDLKILLPGLHLNNIIAYTNQMNTVKWLVSAGRASVIICKGAIPMANNIVEKPLLGAKPFAVTAIWKKNRLLSSAALKLVSSLEL